MIKSSHSFNNYWKITLICFASMIFILIPNTIQNHGLFMYTGDYTFQQIPFYYHAADYIKNCSMGWDWYTDLGSDFISSYSYYLVGSPFFWMISWLYGTSIVYAMPVMLALKTSVSALGAYLYIERYVKKEEAVFVGSFMYAFSGFQMASLVFNTFHDITALFPFLLLSFDKLVRENKKLFFASMVALTALTNYFFFVGVCLFVLIYYIVKCLSKEFKFSISNFLLIIFESLIGVGIAAVILFPTFLELISLDRVGEKLYGVNLVSYSDNTIIPKILQSMFLIPDPSSGGMLFKSEDNTHNWASISLYLPIFTVTGVYVFVKNNSKNWISVLLKICFIFAVIPGLNSAFTLFSSSYYARWYYMPILIMCLATSKALDSDYDLNSGIKFASIGLLLLGIVFCLPNKVIKESEKLSVFMGKTENIEKELRWFSISEVPVLFLQCMAFSVIYLLIVYVYNHEKNKKPDILKKITYVMTVLTVVTFNIFINSTISQTGIDVEKNYESFIAYSPDLHYDEPFRITHVTNKSMNNYSMLWGYMNAGCFHSIESSENDDFFYGVQGYRRNMNSQYGEADYPVFSLLSVKYLFNRSTNDDLNVELLPVDLKGCSLYDKQDCYYIYKNDCFIPFGFAYDYCIDNDSLEEYLDENIDENRYQYKKLVMLRALVLEKEDVEKYKDYIKQLPENMLEELDEETYISDCKDRKAMSCSSFTYDSKGYKAEITTDRKTLVYFSVPCSSGWTAKVNDKDAEVIKVHYGLTAVAVEPGESRIEFTYRTPGLDEGIKITLASLMVFVIYFFSGVILNKRRIMISLNQEK